MPEAYYLSLLDKQKQQAYRALREGLLAAAPSFPVPAYPAAELAELFTFVRLDCPEIFYAPGFSYRYVPGAATVEFIPEYLFQKKELQTHRAAVQARLDRLVRQASGLDEAGREQFAHDFICKNVRYDKLKKAYSHEVIGPLTQGVGVCEGIAKTVKLLCDALKVPCIIAFSENNPAKGIQYRHAWNIVRLGGKYYHLDATFDNTLGSPDAIRYDYYNLDDSALFRDHERLVWPMPPCTDKSRFYYLAQKRSFTKYEEVRSRAQQALRKKQPLLFHWRGGYLTRKVLRELCVILGEEAQKKGCGYALQLNWPQAVLQAEFTPQTGSGAVALQNANAGEELPAARLEDLPEGE